MRLPSHISDCLAHITRAVAELPNVTRVVLFGSFARGTYTRESDLDVAVFFRGSNPMLLEEYRQLVKLCRTPDIDVQVQAFLEEELSDPCGIIEEIVKYGIELPLSPQA